MRRRFRQVDVFGESAYRGNPLAVVLDAEDLTTEQMQAFATWTNLSETTFLLPPTQEGAHYRVRIFTPTTELPFAGHPTLGSCHAWLAENDCADDAFWCRSAAPAWSGCGAPTPAWPSPRRPLVRSGPVDEADLRPVLDVLGVDRDEVVEAQWVDNGPGWVAVLLDDAAAALAVRPGPVGDLDIGVVGLHPPGSPCALEVRAFFGVEGATVEDPVTGSLNASVAQWLTSSGRLPDRYVASQGTAIGRAGRVHVERDEDGTVWVGGATVTCVEGDVEL